MKISEVIAAGCAFALLAIFYFWDSLGADSIIGGGDNLFFFIPIRKLWIQIAQSFSFPLWNPHANIGMPLFATIQPAILYPFSWLYFLFSFNSVFNFTIVIHYALAGFFMYLLVRSWKCGPEGAAVSAFSFMFSGYLFSVHRYLSTLLPTVWVPLLLLLVFSGIIKKDKRYIVFASLVASVMIFSGGIEACYQIFPLIAILGLFPNLLFEGNFKSEFWTRFRLLSLFGTVLAGMTAVQLGPTLELSHWSIRRYGLGEYEANVWSLKLRDLFLFFTLDFYGYFGNTESYFSEQNWLQTLYIGLPPFLLAIYSFRRLGKKSWTVVSIIAVSILLALGKNAFLFPFLRENLPLFDSFRYPVKFIFPMILIISICAGIGFDQLKKDILAKGQDAAFVVSILYLGVGFIIGFGLIEFFKPSLMSQFEVLKIVPPFYNEPWINLGNLQRLLAFSSIFCLFLFLSAKRMKVNSWIFFLPILVLGADLFFGNHGLSFKVPAKHVDEPSENMKFLASQPGVFRTYVTKETKKDYYRKKVKSQKLTYEDQARFIRSLTGVAYGVNYVEGQTVMRPYFFDNIRGILNTMPIKNRLNLLNLFNAKYIVSAKELNYEGLKLIRLEPGGLAESISSESLTALKEKDTIKIYQNEKVLPRAFLAENCQVIKNENDYPAIFSRDDFNPGKMVLLNKSPEGLTCNNETRPLTQNETVEILDYSPNSIDLEVHAEKKRLLFLSDAFFPGWRAIINGEETEIYRSNYAFRSIVIKPGKNLVRFEYNPTPFQIGRIISFFAFVFILFIILKGYRTKSPSLSNQSID
jgi:hypothetical protein